MGMSPASSAFWHGGDHEGATYHEWNVFSTFHHGENSTVIGLDLERNEHGHVGGHGAVSTRILKLPR